jgi:hypothetical protein
MGGGSGLQRPRPDHRRPAHREQGPGGLGGGWRRAAAGQNAEVGGAAERYDAGHSHAAPRTPDESPCAAGFTGVVKLSENTCGAMAGRTAG